MEVGYTSLGSFSARFTELVGETHGYRAGDHAVLATVPGCMAKNMTRPSRRSRRIADASGAPAR